MASSLWFFYALGAAILWGLSYALSEKLLKLGLQPSFLLLIEISIGVFLVFLINYFTGSIKPGFEIMTSKNWIFPVILLMSVCFIGGSFLIFQSVSLKNATITSLIEISYPIFTFLFAWLILKEVQLNLATAFGALLIFSGVAVIYLKS